MTKRPLSNLPASVHQRLLTLARTAGDDANVILSRFACERLLYRLAQSQHAGQFVLKGAVMFLVWTRNMYRPTMDLDLLGFGEDSVTRLEQVFRDCCDLQTEPDGLAFDPSSVQATVIREGREYQGKRVTMLAMLGKARIPVQVDVGFGDVISPRPDHIIFPTLLDFPAPEIRAITRETAVAEKFHAMVELGIANSRMKDFSDIWTLAQLFDFDGGALAGALAATFQRRRTALPNGVPLALTAAFADERMKQVQWNAFQRKSRLSPLPLPDIIASLARFLTPVLTLARSTPMARMHWPKGGPWSTEQSSSENPISELWLALSRAQHSPRPGESILDRLRLPPWEHDDLVVQEAWERLTRPENVAELEEWAKANLNQTVRHMTEEALKAARSRSRF